MIKMSTGEDSTLGNYRKRAVATFGERSEGVKFLDEKISSNPNGDKEEVFADESQMIYLLTTLSR